MFDVPNHLMRRILIPFFSLTFLYSFANDETQAPAAYFNWVSIWLCFFFGLLFTILFRFLNKHSKTIDQRSNPGMPMGGWIIFLGINLLARFVLQIYFFWNADYFLESTWKHLAESGGMKYQLLFIFQLFLSLFAVAGTGALIYWFFGRRDIFPTLFIYYASIYIVVTCLLLVIYHFMKLPPEMFSIRQNLYVQLIRIVYTASLMIFVWKSEQVKQTFVYPPG
jgi:Protein of unknown function (DUF2569)